MIGIRVRELEKKTVETCLECLLAHHALDDPQERGDLREVRRKEERDHVVVLGGEEVTRVNDHIVGCREGNRLGILLFATEDSRDFFARRFELQFFGQEEGEEETYSS